ncbi:hypothetical protein I4F81_006536 [Pyropia yezoensis]|uniref:Uncharacterized protein n=2 Tax=Pyropia yezoensis TaxID=2788 RepID=A0ACC3C1H7_PYRYE|nr:hypothetical protein I4F81_006536 [Neopyropia yezoensis]WBU86749.1 small heat shock protein [Neopyropia yezoensis]BBJ35514.1 small heat-shock protein [Neopyropia yezoensis]|eukprot:contig_17765_g4357
MDLFALDLFNPPAAPQRRSRATDPWALWRPMTDPSWAHSMSVWQPHSTVSRSEDGKMLNIRFETPGFPRDRLNIELSDDQSVLTVSGSMRKETKADDAGEVGGSQAQRNPWSSVEERQFSQSYRLPRDADVESIKADYEHGVLAIAVPSKGSEALPQKRTIAIENKDPQVTE